MLKRNRRQFTLVEMLVVIAIIATLAAMLAPALQKALHSSYALSCQNNMRTVMFGWQTWIGENNNTIPPLTTGASDSTWNRRGVTSPLCNEYDPASSFTSGVLWVVLLQNHLGMGKFGRTAIASSDYWSLAAQDQKGIFFCPASPNISLYLSEVQYGINQWNIGGRNSNGCTSISKISDFYSPSRKVILMDTYGAGSSGTAPGCSSFYGFDRVKMDFARHNTGISNCTYADGHVGQWTEFDHAALCTAAGNGYKTAEFGYGKQKGTNF